MPAQLINFGGNGDSGQTSMLGALLSLLTAEKLGVEIQPKKAAVEPPVAKLAPAATPAVAPGKTAGTSS